LHLRDEAITEPKLASLAVSVEKTEEPVWVSRGSTFAVQNLALTTTTITALTSTVTIPAWVGEVTALVVARLAAANGSGALQDFIIDIGYNGINFPGGAQVSIAIGANGELVLPWSFSLSAPGTSLDLNVFARTLTGTNSSNQVRMSWIMVGVR
jgi:hypothetical protein